jgi:hypothetical protein
VEITCKYSSLLLALGNFSTTSCIDLLISNIDTNQFIYWIRNMEEEDCAMHLSCILIAHSELHRSCMQEYFSKNPDYKSYENYNKKISKKIRSLDEVKDGLSMDHLRNQLKLLPLMETYLQSLIIRKISSDDIMESLLYYYLDRCLLYMTSMKDPNSSQEFFHLEENCSQFIRKMFAWKPLRDKVILLIFHCVRLITMQSFSKLIKRIVSHPNWVHKNQRNLLRWLVINRGNKEENEARTFFL